MPLGEKVPCEARVEGRGPSLLPCRGPGEVSSCMWAARPVFPAAKTVAIVASPAFVLNGVSSHWGICPVTVFVALEQG